MAKVSEKYNYKSDFPNRLSDLMKERGATQKQIAEICDVTRQSVSQWQNGETRPDILYLKSIAEYFQVSTDYLLGLTDVQTTNTATKELCASLGLSEETIGILTANTHSALANRYREIVTKDFIKSGEAFDDELIEGETTLVIEALSYKVSQTIDRLIDDYVDAMETAFENDSDYWTERSLIELLHHFFESLEASECFSIEDLTKGIKATDNRYSLLNSSFAMKRKDGKFYWLPTDMKELIINSAIGEINTRLHNIKYEKG